MRNFVQVRDLKMPVVNVKKLKYKNTDFYVFEDDKLFVHTGDQGKRLQLIIFVDFFVTFALFWQRGTF